MTNDEQRLINAYRESLESGSDFVLVIQSETLDTGGNLLQIKRACPTRIYEVSKPLYDFAVKLQTFFPKQTSMFLLEVSDNLIQIFDIKNGT